MVLVIGGTRGTGFLIAQRLERQGVAVRVLARDPTRARVRLGPMSEIVVGDITRGETLPPAIAGATHLIFTAGCRSGRPATEAQIRSTEFGGVVNTTRSIAAVALNLYKGNTLVWRRRAEVEIRRSVADYTIIRAGVLLNQPGGQRAIVVTQDPLPLSIRYRIARADVAEAFVAALDHPGASQTTFEVVWGKGPRSETWPGLLAGLKPD